MSFFSDVERSLEVQSLDAVADGVLAIRLAPANGRDLPEWSAGSHVDVTLPNGDQRQYSLCGDPADRAAWTIAVLREPEGRGGSELLHRSLALGQVLRVRGPRNHFAFSPRGAVTFIAGGIGITPIRSMIAVAAAAGMDWTLYYAGRSRSTMAFVDDLHEAHGARVRVFAADEGSRLDLATLIDSAPAGTELYCCGPARLLDAVQSASLGRPDLVLHQERFEAVEFGDPVWPDSFEVELEASGITITVPPGRSILDVVEEHDVLVPSSCRTGTCGTCETPVIDGEIEHRDSILTPAEREESAVMMICVSRAACGRISLEL